MFAKTDQMLPEYKPPTGKNITQNVYSHQNGIKLELGNKIEQENTQTL